MRLEEEDLDTPRRPFGSLFLENLHDFDDRLISLRMSHLEAMLEVAKDSKDRPDIVPPNPPKDLSILSTHVMDEWDKVTINKYNLKFMPIQAEQSFQLTSQCKAFVAPNSTRGTLAALFSFPALYAFIVAWTTTGSVEEEGKVAMQNRAWGVAIASFVCVLVLSFIPYVKQQFHRNYTVTVTSSLTSMWLCRTLLVNKQGSLGLAVSLFVTFLVLRGKFTPSLLTCCLDVLMYNIYHIIQIITETENALMPLELAMLDMLQIFLIVLGSLVAYKYEKALRNKYLLNQQYKVKKRHTQEVLDNIFPPHINNIIQENAATKTAHNLAFAENSLTILFCDVLSMKDMMKDYSPAMMVSVLDGIYSVFDQVCENLCLHKMETVGKTYMACAGIPGTRKDHALACAEMAKEMLKLMERAGVVVRIGVHTGGVIAGVVGMLRPQFSLFGDTVNTSARVQSTGEPGGVAISTTTYEMLGDVYHTKIKEVQAKGKGTLRVYLLEDRLVPADPHREFDLVPMKDGNNESDVQDDENLQKTFEVINHFSLSYMDPRIPIARGVDSSLEPLYVKFRYGDTRWDGFSGPCLVVIVVHCLELLFEYTNQHEGSPLPLEVFVVVPVVRGVICALGVLMAAISYQRQCVSDVLAFRLQNLYFLSSAFVALIMPLYIAQNTVKEYPQWSETYMLEYVDRNVLRADVVFILSLTVFTCLGVRFRHCLQVYAISLLGFALVFWLSVPSAFTEQFFNIVYYTSFLLTAMFLNLTINYARELFLRRGFVLTFMSEQEHRKAEFLLYQMLPPTVGRQLMSKQRSRAEIFSDVTILYSDIKNFTKYSASSSPDRVVTLLSTLFSIFDLLTEKHCVYKIQTIGDAYVLVSGFPFCTNEEMDGYSKEEWAPAAAFHCMAMGVDMLRAVAQVRTQEGAAIQMRLGIHTGTLIAGVVGEKKLRYDMWGTDCLVANELESLATPQCILLSEVTKSFLEKCPQGKKDPRFSHTHAHEDFDGCGVKLKTFEYGPIDEHGLADEEKTSSNSESEGNEKGADLNQLSQKLGVQGQINETKEGATVATRLVWTGNNRSQNSKSFLDNTVTNTKYKWWNFIFKNLNEQLRLWINRYFWLVAFLQLIPTLTPVHPASTWVPLLLLFAFTAVKDLRDDLKRARADAKSNKALVKVARDGKIIDIMSKEVVVGDVLYLTDGEPIPADIALLKTSYPAGNCFLQTSNLDGETNFKNRQALHQTQQMSKSAVHDFTGAIECAVPNPSLYDFDSRMWPNVGDISDFKKAPPHAPEALTGTQLLQQGARLVNTEWILGVVVYSGNETKFGMNKELPPLKITKIEKVMNNIAMGLFGFQLMLAIVWGAVGIGYYEQTRSTALWMLASGDDQVSTDKLDFDVQALLIFWGRFLLLNSTFIPISLKVSLDVCKILYAGRINKDLELYDPETNTRANTNSTSISEDLGQIKFVLSDKTGTLTQNIMHAKGITVGQTPYDSKALSSAGTGGLKAAVMEGKQPELQFLRNCALNNNAYPTRCEDSRKIVYKASSPDEIALVEAAASAGVELTERDGDNVKIEVCGKEEAYELLQELEFNSDRKRMATVYRKLSTNELLFFVKGADDVLIDKLALSETAGSDGKTSKLEDALERLENYAKGGFRTLFFAERQLSEEEFKMWSVSFKVANTSLVNREADVAECFAKLECNLTIQGITAIEDKLQDKVPETIFALRDAGVHVWMLTGDKFSTALEIAKACGLTTHDCGKVESRPLLTIDGGTPGSVGDTIRQHTITIKTLKLTGKLDEVTIIAQGPTLAIALRYHPKKLAELCIEAKAVICCRVTPRQKADLVSIVKDKGHMTLAIGDGGNDVAMIQRSHVGVGIRGKEGLQASRASDYAVANFKALRPLMFKHGHLSYVRTATVIMYSYYKSFCFCIMQNCYAFFTQFSGTSLFSTLNVTSYNALLFFPIATFAFEKDFSIPSLMNIPQLYSVGADSTLFTLPKFIWWMARATLQAIVLLFVTLGCLQSNASSEGWVSLAEYDNFGNTVFLGYLLLQVLTMYLSLKSLCWPSLLVISLTFLFFCFMRWLSSAFNIISIFHDKGAVTNAFNEPVFYLTWLLTSMAAFMPYVAFKAWQLNFNPTPGDVFRLQERLRSGKTQNKIVPMECDPEVAGADTTDRKVPYETM